MKESTKFVMDNITKALLTLMKDKPITSISICAIIDKSMASRNSFYRHFKDKDDILRYYISSETEAWLSSSPISYVSASSPQEYIIFLLQHLYEYRDIIDLLIRDNRLSLLEEEFDKRFYHILSGISDPWHIAFTTGGFYKLFCYWAKTGYEKTPAEIASYIQ
ncbi:MAG: TetR/AcrR family transcriptional regulator [Spirochaetales bacterium]|nr:TetR/AcrR family transcriptional regulator [Spirochaetales bacterium]